MFKLSRVLKLGALSAAVLFSYAMAGSAHAGEANAKSKVETERIDGQSFEQSAIGERFGAIAVATTDVEWGKKWKDAPSGKLPKLPEARFIGLGQQVEIVVFLATRGKAYEAKKPLEYSLSIYKPDGALQETIEHSQCLPKDYKLEADSLGVCDTVLKFELEDADPRGQWIFKIKIDSAGQESLVFGTSFETF